jgi:arginyl-tRNA synthetase
LKRLSHEIAALVEAAIRAAQADSTLPTFDLPPIEITPPKRAEHGDFATAVAMGLAKPAKLNPFAIATAIANHISQPEYLSAVEVVHPGFINFRLTDDWLRAQTETIIAEGDAVFTLDIGAGQRAQVEFVSANPTGPLHIGRSRGAIVGDVMARLLSAAGYDVQREYYFNNAGVQMNNLAISLRVRYRQALDLPPIDGDELHYQGAYLADFGRQLAAERGDTLKDAELEPFKAYGERKMFDMIRATLQRVDIHHDVFFNENSLYESGVIWDVLKQLDERGYIYRAVQPEVDDQSADEDAEEKHAGKSAATWFRSSRFGDKKDRVMVKANDEPTYTLPDIAYHVNKLDRGFAVCVNVLGADHFVQHQVVKYGLRALDYDPSKVHVIIVQIVHLLKDGKPFKQSTRAGNFETLDDLIDQTSADAVRYMLLSRSADAQMNFDVDLAVKQSNENPVYYVQYAYVRCAGIFREAGLRGVTDSDADVRLLGDAELKFLRKALELGDVIAQAARTYEPHRIAFYALELANTFHPIFDTVRVLHSDVAPDVAKARLRFYRAAQVVLKRVLTLMGMSAPEYM